MEQMYYNIDFFLMKIKMLTISPTIFLRPKNYYNNRKSIMIFIRPKGSHTIKNRIMIILILKWSHMSMTILMMILKTKRQKRIVIFCQ